MAWTNPTTWTTGVPTAAQFNTYIRDNLNCFGDHGTWSTYAVVLSATGSNPSWSGGHNQGAYQRAGNLVLYHYYLEFGASPNAGSGTYSVSLPVNGNFNTDTRPGSGYLLDLGAFYSYVTCHYSTSTAASSVNVMWNAQSAAGKVTHASPFGWAQGDKLAGMLTYRAAT